MCILSLMNVFFISLQYEMDLIWMELRTTGRNGFDGFNCFNGCFTIIGLALLTLMAFNSFNGCYCLNGVIPLMAAMDLMALMAVIALMVEVPLMAYGSN